MKTVDDRIFYYQAGANPIGGSLTHPVQATLHNDASCTLPQAGGKASGRIEKFNLHDVIRTEAAYSYTTGSIQKSTGNFTTLVTSVVEGLKIFDVVTADRIVSSLAIEHHRDGYYPKCSFTGSNFDNLKISGQLITANPDHNFLKTKVSPERGWPDRYDDERPDEERSCRQREPDWAGFPDQNWTLVNSFLQRAGGQSDKILRSDAPQDIKNRFRWVKDAEGRKKRGYVLCSLVDDVEGAAPGSNFGHVIDIPDLGRLFLGELIVDPIGFRLTMLRAEFGCRGDGDCDVATGSGSGVPMP